jgi:hypothetical protein
MALALTCTNERTVLWLLLLYYGKLVPLSLLFSVNWIILHERACMFPHSPLRAWLAACFVISAWALLLWFGFGLIVCVITSKRWLDVTCSPRLDEFGCYARDGYGGLAF